MKTTTSPTSALPRLPAPRPRPQQLIMAFDTPAILGLAADQRTTAVRALTVMLLQAAGVRLGEDDDAER